MEVMVSNQQKVKTIQIEQIQSNARKILNALDVPEGELSILLVDDDQIAEMNSQYLGREGPTNVLAFPMLEGPHSEINPGGMLGDVVISVETVIKEAIEGGLTPEEMLDFYLIHGILHLVGFDHLGTHEEAERMEEKTRELWQILGHPLTD